MIQQPNPEKTVLTTCPHDCGGRCVLKVHVHDGVIREIETDDGGEPNCGPAAAAEPTAAMCIRKTVSKHP